MLRALYYHCFSLFCHISCKWFARLRHQWLVCFSTESLKIMVLLNKTINTSCQLNFTTSPTPSSLWAFLSLSFPSLHPAFLHPTSPLPTPAVLMHFHPQRWRAESCNYPSVCEMNHWATDWAAWWETSILSSLTECSQPTAPYLCWCPGLAWVHTQ